MTEQLVDGEAVWAFGPGDRLRRAREAAGYDVKAFSEITGLDRATIHKWEFHRRLEVAPLKVLNLYKMATDAPSVEWFRTGVMPSPNGSNPRSTAYKSHASRSRMLKIVREAA